MGRTPGFRRAVIVSVAVHVAIVAVLVGIAVWPVKPRATQAHLDTRTDEIVLRDDPGEPVAVTTESRPSEPPASQPGLARKPLAKHIPAALPAEILAVIRRGQPTAAVVDPHVTPAAASQAVRPMHGAMKSGQAVVYVLDCSGSMGEFGKLTCARAALVATLRRQPETVRFQVVLYNNTTRNVFHSGLVPATVANIATVETELARLEPSGRSNHAGAIRAAANLRPDVILLLTDADSLTAVKLPGEKPVPVCVARVTPEHVEQPRELR